MSTTTGAVLFSRGEINSDFDEVWDDTALIEAYDKAVNSAKEIIKQRRDVSSVCGNVSESSSNVENPKPNLGRRRRRGSHREKNIKGKWASSWQHGDYCRAIYPADGKMYEAEIKSVNVNDGTCAVQFVGYGNSEEVLLKNLQPSNGQLVRESQMEEAELAIQQEIHSLNDNPHKVKHSGKQYKHAKEGQSSSLRKNLSKAGKRRSSSGSFSHLPGIKDQMPFFSPPWASSPPSSIPPMHLPPPPLPFSEDADEDDEALSSMLIAWYMSGYHTGFYQGLKCGKNKASASCCTASGSKRSSTCSPKCSKLHN